MARMIEDVFCPPRHREAPPQGVLWASPSPTTCLPKQNRCFREGLSLEPLQPWSRELSAARKEMWPRTRVDALGQMALVMQQDTTVILETSLGLEILRKDNEKSI